MDNLPGSVPGAVPRRKSTPPHPRRPPAHKSVSLRHSPPTDSVAKNPLRVDPRTQRTTLSSPNPPASDKANPPSSVSPKINNKQSSGESSDAGKWFENTNNNAVQSNASFVDNDPPFFLRNSSSSGTPPDGHDYRAAALRQQSTSIPYRPGLTHMGTEGSSTEDFRSVIDDLTVANKKLKQKLKKYEKLYDAHLQDEKLFEVRFHGLPDHKKKELEETLRKFASGLDDHPTAEYPNVPYPAPLDPHKTASSLNSRFADSGYNSISASGQNSSVTHSGQTAPSGQFSDHKMSKSQYSRQQQSIRSYLQDIPAGLLPRPNAPMTEKSKKKLVVRRLEQIFAGKLSMPGNHSQQMQQEEVAQSAAMADRQAKEATGQRFNKEGQREARIMPGRNDDEEMSSTVPTESIQKLRPTLAVHETDFAGSNSPDQRPTRPLDLDPYRAQVPAENMEYIRHLGFTPPDMETGAAPEDDHGWLYLNLLINMAQLHTINVTPDFVKEAVTEYSSKFELSHDGRKIRWKGGHDLSKESDTSSERLSGNSPYDTLADSNYTSPSKRLKTGQSGESGESSSMDPDRQARRTARAARQRDQNKLAYIPIFYHKDDSEDEDDFYNIDMSSSNSPFLTQQRGDSSGFGSSAMRSQSSRKKREDGPIIFYNKAKFCTDLSGDRRGVSVVNPASYKPILNHPLGSGPGPVRSGLSSSIFDDNEPKGQMSSTPMEIDSKSKGSVRTASSDENLGFSPEALQSNDGNDSPDVMEFEASGLGGVQPDDNFSIRVKRSQTRAESSVLGEHNPKHTQLYPEHIREALRKQPFPNFSGNQPIPHPVIKEELLSATRKNLPSSTLPPASFLPFDSTSSGDVDSDLESDVSSGPSTSSSSNSRPVGGLPHFNISPAHRQDDSVAEDCDSGDEESSDEESDSDGSVDLLATARKLAPGTIRASEREYDAELAERLAEDIPAGSSAATAGGGSGFNSPASKSGDVGEESDRMKWFSSASGSASTRTRNLKRTRTSDSLATALKSEKMQKKR